ncbi:MAG: hypothetical protein WEB03_06500, partial [Nitriliruptor sp.]|uniref:hypothetical protein n=1 Tax=Nitriliruptor sp. TaxID=2448056 RepID=UPI0034A02452
PGSGSHASCRPTVAAEPLRADTPVELPVHGTAGQLWSGLLDLADAKPHGWTLVGALMVMLHEFEAGTSSGRATADADTVVEARGITEAVRDMARQLLDLGWSLDDEQVDIEGHGYTFRRGAAALDLIAPEGLGARADLTTIPPLKAPALPGTRQALDRSQHLAVVQGGRSGIIPRPNLLGTLVIKSCAAVHDRTAAAVRHREDLARLYSLVTDPAGLAKETRKKDRQRLRAAPEPVWEILTDPSGRASAQLAYRHFTGV